MSTSQCLISLSRHALTRQSVREGLFSCSQIIIIHNLIEEKMCVSWVLLLSLLDTHTNTHIQIMSQLHVCSCYYITSGDISSTVFNLNNGERERKRARAWKRERDWWEWEREREVKKAQILPFIFPLCAISDHALTDNFSARLSTASWFILLRNRAQKLTEA